jgi:hypothetical protein
LSNHKCEKVDPSDITPTAAQKNKTANPHASGAIATVQEDGQNKITTHRRVPPRQVKTAVGGEEKDDQHNSKRQKQALITDSSDESTNEFVNMIDELNLHPIPFSDEFFWNYCL